MTFFSNYLSNFNLQVLRDDTSTVIPQDNTLHTVLFDQRTEFAFKENFSYQCGNNSTQCVHKIILVTSKNFMTYCSGLTMCIYTF
jgi:hypothetical protein